MLQSGKPSDHRRKPFGIGGKPFMIGGKPFTIGGKPFMIGGKPFSIGGKPFNIGGKPFRLGKFAVIGRDADRSAVGAMEESDVISAYRRWAPVYDHTFGIVAAEGRKHAVEILNRGSGKILEVGVGTGLSLPTYKRSLDIVGIDLSPEMLEKARERVFEKQLKNVSGLHVMDASQLTFADNTFDTVVAMYVMTVVPDPEKVMRELARVCKPGGQVMLVNHFSQDEGMRGWIERQMAPFGDKLGWRPLFDTARVTVCDDLKVMETRALRPFGLFTMMRFVKTAAREQAAA